MLSTLKQFGSCKSIRAAVIFNNILPSFLVKEGWVSRLKWKVLIWHPCVFQFNIPHLFFLKKSIKSRFLTVGIFTVIFYHNEYSNSPPMYVNLHCLHF